MKRQTQQQNQTTLSANRCYFCDGMFSVPNIPKVLPCLHILCRDCITSIIHSQQIKFKNNDENSIYCPLCKCFIPLPPNYMSVLPTPYKLGYKFLGWYVSSDFAGSSVSSIKSENAAGNLVYYAKWEKK